MTEKLIIKNFAGIKELEIEIKPINIMIGPQASGKSICAKLLYFFKNFIWRSILLIQTGEKLTNLSSSELQVFESYFPTESLGVDNFILRYEIEDAFISVTRNFDKQENTLEYSEFFSLLFNDLSSIVESKFEAYDVYQWAEVMTLRRRILDKQIEKLLDTRYKNLVFRQLFIPEVRSLFAILEISPMMPGDISFVSSSGRRIDLHPILSEFAFNYKQIKDNYFRFKAINPNKYDDYEIVEIDHLINKILVGDYVKKNNREFFIMSDGRTVSFENLSSGQKESLPITVILSQLVTMTNNSIYIEEPEAHLFPNSQRNIIELIATVFNYRKQKLQFFITTHSPYILTSINNLLQAGIIYQNSDRDVLDKLEKIVPKYKSLNTADVAAYVLQNGECRNIICEQTGLIDATIIDDVSEEIDVQFDELLDLV